jgi:hypothetical protein
MNVFAGCFYEFHRERVISRPGQPLSTTDGVEIGPYISREEALSQLRAGRDGGIHHAAGGGGVYFGRRGEGLDES